MLNHGYDISASAELSVHFSSEIFFAKHKNSLVAKRTIHGRTLGRPLDSWVAFGDWATVFQQHCVPYPRMLRSEQKCAHFCSEWSIVGYGAGAFWDL